MAKSIAHGRPPAAHRDSGGGWVALLVVALLAAAVWGAWKLGVMAGDQADWRQRLPETPSILRKAPNPQPAPIPLQRRPAVRSEGVTRG